MNDEERKSSYNKKKQIQEEYAKQISGMKRSDISPSPTTSLPLKETIEGDEFDLNEIAKMYAEKFSNEKWYQAPEKNEDGNLLVSFPDEKTAMDFSEDMAKKGLKFIIFDEKTGEVCAYSNGDGKLNKNEDGRTLDDIRSEFRGQQNTP